MNAVKLLIGKLQLFKWENLRQWDVRPAAVGRVRQTVAHHQNDEDDDEEENEFVLRDAETAGFAVASSRLNCRAVWVATTISCRVSWRSYDEDRADINTHTNTTSHATVALFATRKDRSSSKDRVVRFTASAQRNETETEQFQNADEAVLFQFLLCLKLRHEWNQCIRRLYDKIMIENQEKKYGNQINFYMNLHLTDGLVMEFTAC